MLKILAVVLASVVLGGCSTAGGLEKRGFMSEGFGMPMALGQAPDNPSILLSIRPLGSGTNSGKFAGANGGADVGRIVSGVGGNDLASMAVGVGVGIVGAGIGAVAGAFGDTKAAAKGRDDSDLFEVLPMSAYFLDPAAPMKSPEIAKYKRFGDAKRYLVRFDRKNARYEELDFIVLKETEERIAGRKVYRAIDIFDAKAGDTNSNQFLARIQGVARKHGRNLHGDSYPQEM